MPKPYEPEILLGIHTRVWSLISVCTRVMGALPGPGPTFKDFSSLDPWGVGVGELEIQTNGGVIYLSQFNAILPAILSSTTWWCVCVCVYESNVAQ